MNLKSGAIAFIVILFLSFPVAAEEHGAMSVSGNAEIRVVPDEVVLTLGVETWNENVSEARKQNDESIAKIMALAKEYKIEPKHVQTDHIEIESKYDYKSETRQQFLVGYFVRKTIAVTLKDVSKFDAFYVSAVEAGANRVHGVEFRTTELRKYKDQARALAIQAAREKAADLAKVLDQKVGKARSITEDSSGWRSWYNSAWGYQGGGGMAQNVIQNVGGNSPELEGGIAPGQITVTASVHVNFDLD